MSKIIGIRVTTATTDGSNVRCVFVAHLVPVSKAVWELSFWKSSSHDMLKTITVEGNKMIAMVEAGAWIQKLATVDNLSVLRVDEVK